MNEWSPGGNYSYPGTPIANGRLGRYQQVESGRGIKPLVVKKRAQIESRSRNYLQHSMEDVSKGLTSNSCKKIGGNGASDPRFKRVVPLGVQNDACVGTEAKTAKPLIADRKDSLLSKFPILNAPEFKPNKTWVECIKNSEDSKLNSEADSVQDKENFTAAKDVNLNQSQHHLNEDENLPFDNDFVENSICKDSASDCTVNTRNTSLVSEESTQEFSNTLTRTHSPTTVNKVENWMQDQGPKLEKKHSVITVIGQMQEPDVLSSALQEINKRRKLVKELDRYAVCRKIIETDKEKEISDIMLKISSLNANGNVLFCDSNETLNVSSPSTKNCGDKLTNPSLISNTEKTASKCKDLNVDSPVAVSRKTSFAEANSGYSNKGKIKMMFSSLPFQKIFFVLIFMSLISLWFAFFSIHKNAYVTFDLFNSKPKPMTWYERICNWLWEFFRPSDNYHRTSHWRNY